MTKKICKDRKSRYLCNPNAEIAQLVERNLAKVEVAGPNPVFRSERIARYALLGYFHFRNPVELHEILQIVD